MKIVAVKYRIITESVRILLPGSSTNVGSVGTNGHLQSGRRMTRIWNILISSLRLVAAVVLAFIIPLGVGVAFAWVAQILFIPYNESFYLGGGIGAFLGYLIIRKVLP